MTQNTNKNKQLTKRGKVNSYIGTGFNPETYLGRVSWIVLKLFLFMVIQTAGLPTYCKTNGVINLNGGGTVNNCT